MAHLRFYSFLFMLVLVHSTDFSVHGSHLDATATERRSVYSVPKVRFNGDSSMAAAVGKTMIGGGRKMMLKENSQDKKETTKMESPNRIDSSKVSTFVNCKHKFRKGVRKVECKVLRKRPQAADNQDVKTTAFSADYHIARSHPPRHN